MLYTHAIAALLAAAVSSVAVWNIQDWRFSAKELERLEQEREVRMMREKAISAAAANLEKAKEGERVVYRTIVKTVERIVERPVYSNVCLDADGVMAINRGSLE
jgi:hypothetical protein